MRRLGRWWRGIGIVRFFRREVVRRIARNWDRLSARATRFGDRWRSALPPPRKRFGRWRSGRWNARTRPIATIFVPLMTLVLVAAVVLTVLAFIQVNENKQGLFGLDKRCSTAGTSCSVLASVTLALIPISVGVVWVFVIRLDRVRSRYRKEAWTHPAE